MFTHPKTTNICETLINTAIPANPNPTPNGSLKIRWCKGRETRAPPYFSGIPDVFRV